VKTSSDENKYLFERTKVEVGEITDICFEIAESSRQKLVGKQVLIKGIDNIL
jgi:hypothetical protein